MNDIKTGGPAFPPNGEWRDDQGMTLRDYFAAKAMQGDISLDVNGRMSYATIAERAYSQADAMLKAREVQS